MIPRRAVPAILLTITTCLLAVSTLGCSVAAVPGRFTYVVKYEVTAEFAATSPDSVDITYLDGTGPQPSGLFIPPQSFEVTFDYDYAAPFDPEMTFNSASFTDVGDKIIVKIIWKDYKTDFQEEMLAAGVIEYDGAPPAALTIHGDQLPK